MTKEEAVTRLEAILKAGEEAGKDIKYSQVKIYTTGVMDAIETAIEIIKQIEVDNK